LPAVWIEGAAAAVWIGGAAGEYRKDDVEEGEEYGGERDGNLRRVKGFAPRVIFCGSGSVFEAHRLVQHSA